MSAVIDVQHLHKRFGNRVAIEDVSFSVGEGEVFGLLGATGAGKTTVLECLVGLRVPDGGAIRVLGHDPCRERAEVTKRLGGDVEAGRSRDLAPALSLYHSFYRDPAVWRSLMDTPESLDRLALAGNPDVLVFDNLTADLDAEARREMWAMVESVRDGGTTVLLATSCLDEAERLCDRVALIDRGRVAIIGSPYEPALRAGGVLT
jgi:ABC-2 type transport system ATP-binding protein